MKTLTADERRTCEIIAQRHGFDTITVESVYLQTESAIHTRSAAEMAERFGCTPLGILHYPERYGLVLIDGEYIRT